MTLHIHRRWWFCLVLLIISIQSTWALTGASWTNLVSGDLTNSFKWNPVGTPTADNDVYITNYIGNTSIFLTNRQTTAGMGPTNGNLTVFNTGGTGVFTLLLSNSTYMVTNNTTIGANAVVQLGNSFINSASTFSNNNLYLAGNGAINFNAPNLASPSTLIVAGQFTNTTANAIASLNGSAAQLLFTANNIVTNQGALLFTALNAGAVGNTGLVLQVAGGANTFYNQGTVTLGAAATVASRAYVFSNQLVNAGTFVLTNNAAATTNYFSVTGLAGSALTNAGLLKLFAGSATAQNVATLNNGGFVNTGTLLGEATAAAASSLMLLADPAGVFSNAVGGWVVATNNGAFTVQAVSIVNQGTMLATNAATLNLAGVVSGTGFFKAGPGATLNFAGGGSLDFVNALSFTGGTVVVQGQFTNSQAGTYSSVGNLIITNGNFINTSSSSMLLGANVGDKGTLTIANAGSLFITNGAGNAQLMVGQNGIGTLNLNAGGNLVVNQLLVTNNLAGAQTNSFFNFNGGTLITSNAANQVAFNYTVPTNQVFTIGGNWIATGGTNLMTAIPGGQFFGNGLGVYLNAGVSLIVSNGAQWDAVNFVRVSDNGANVHIAVSGTGSALTTANTSFTLTSSNGTLTVANGGFVTGYAVQLGAGNANPDFALVTGHGSVWSNYAANTQGYYSFGVDGGSGVTVSNGGVLIVGYSVNGGYSMGDNGGANGAWTIVTGTGSVLNVYGGQNASLQVGDGISGSNNSNWVLIANGGGLLSTGVILGRRASGANVANSNTVTVTDPGSYWINTSVLYVGGEAGNASFVNNNYNQVIISNGASFKTVGAIVGDSTVGVTTPADWYNSITVTGPGSVMTNTSTLAIGNTYSFGNYVTIANGGAYYGSGAITIGNGPNASNNSLSVISGTFSNAGLVTLGSSGGGFNTLLATNAAMFGTLTIGSGSSNNTASVLANTIWNLPTLIIGSGGGTGNVLNLNGGNLDLASVTIGSGGGLTNFGNSLIVSNGGQISGGAITVGSGSSSNNLYQVGGLGAQSFVSNGVITVGSANAGFNALIVTNALFQSQGATIGNGSSNNTASVLAGSTWNLLGQNLTIGNLASAGNGLTIDSGVVSNVGMVTIGSGKIGSPNTNAFGNSLLINNSGTLVATAVRVGLVAGDNNNAVLVLNDGVLQANSLTITAGTSGNTISNRNAIYQFTTATPAITPNGAGSIAINNGTISFLGIDTADVTASQGTGVLSGITFAGNNTFMLNASSNINAIADQTYTFQAVTGNPSNYVNLVMVNGQTEYGNGDLTIGASGTLLISNTTANIDGNFFNSGTASVVNATANFANTINNHGRLTLQNATLNATAINYATGTIHGNGTLTSDVNSLGTISPVGTLTFVGNLTLLGSSTVIMELTGYGNGVGTNDVINVGENFQYAGTLVVTNTTGFAYAYGQHFYLFNFGSGDQTGDFSVTNLPNLTPYGLAWNTSQLDSIGLLIVVPEPSTILLLAVGVLLLGWLIQMKRRPV